MNDAPSISPATMNPRQKPANQRRCSAASIRSSSVGGSTSGRTMTRDGIVGPLSSGHSGQPWPMPPPDSTITDPPATSPRTHPASAGRPNPWPRHPACNGPTSSSLPPAGSGQRTQRRICHPRTWPASAGATPRPDAPAPVQGTGSAPGVEAQPAPPAGAGAPRSWTRRGSSTILPRRPTSCAMVSCGPIITTWVPF